MLHIDVRACNGGGSEMQPRRRVDVDPARLVVAFSRLVGELSNGTKLG